MQITSVLSSGTRDARIKKINTYIEIVVSTIPRLNAMAPDTRRTVTAVLQTRYTKVNYTVVNDLKDLQALIAKGPDLVILGMKLILLDPTKSYDESPKLWLSEYLNEHGIAYTGSDFTALASEFDKHVAKQKVLDAGLRSSSYFISTLANPTFDHSLRFPLFVKPTNRGNSKGIDEQSVVNTDAELKAKILSIHDSCGSDALIEEYLPGREFSVAVVRQPFTYKLLTMPIELTTPADSKGHSFLSKAVKAADTEKVIAVQDVELKKSLDTLAVSVFKALGARDYGRIDMRLNAYGEPHFIEANLMPGLSTHGYLSRCFFLNEGISYRDMILSIVALGFMRNRAMPQLAAVVSDASPESLPESPLGISVVTHTSSASHI